MKLQISSRIAVFALLELAARPDQQVSVAEVGEKYGISSHHLAKVMHTLARAGLVRSVRGAGGGYLFAGHARRTTLLDVIRLFENIGAGDGGSTEQTAEERALGQILGEIDDIVGATLGSVTLATVLKLVERQRQPGRGARAAAKA
jgi:Rrf2 family nitric oxide-sensitive transcriptional repressor